MTFNSSWGYDQFSSGINDLDCEKSKLYEKVICFHLKESLLLDKFVIYQITNDFDESTAFMVCSYSLAFNSN